MTPSTRLTPAQDHGPMRSIAWLSAPTVELHIRDGAPTLVIRSGSTDIELRFTHGVASLMDFQERFAALDVEEHFPDHFKAEDGA